jgi:hypothetical protein
LSDATVRRGGREEEERKKERKKKNPGIEGEKELLQVVPPESSRLVSSRLFTLASLSLSLSRLALLVSSV